MRLSLVRCLLQLSVCALCCEFLAAQPASASDDYAVVDVQKIVSESIIGKAAKSNLDSEVKKAKVKMANLQADFEKSKADLQKQAGVLSGSALEGRKEALVKKQRDAQKTFQDTQEELAKVNDREIRKVLEEIKKVVDEVADDRGYSFVFERDRQSVVFASERLDITIEVIQRLDKKKVDL